jgi:hypothetical protein
MYLYAKAIYKFSNRELSQSINVIIENFTDIRFNGLFFIVTILLLVYGF